DSETLVRTRLRPYPASTALTSRLLAKIRPFDFRKPQYVLRYSVCNLLPRDQYDNALRELRHGLDDVLDHDNGHAGAIDRKQQIQDLVDLAVGQTRHGFVGEQ